MHVDATQSPALFRLASERLGGHYRHDWNQKILTLIGTQGIVSQAVFTSISPEVKFELTMWATPAARGLGGRHFIRSIFRVGFGLADGQWGCQRATAITRATNEKAQRALVQLGFTFETPLKHWFGAEDGMCFYMLRHDCRWI